MSSCHQTISSLKGHEHRRYVLPSCSPVPVPLLQPPSSQGSAAGLCLPSLPLHPPHVHSPVGPPKPRPSFGAGVFETHLDTIWPQPTALAKLRKSGRQRRPVDFRERFLIGDCNVHQRWRNSIVKKKTQIHHVSSFSRKGAIESHETCRKNSHVEPQRCLLARPMPADRGV